MTLNKGGKDIQKNREKRKNETDKSKTGKMRK